MKSLENNNSVPTVTYAITTYTGAVSNAISEERISINKGTGEIKVSNTAEVTNSGVYIVTATATGTGTYKDVVSSSTIVIDIRNTVQTTLSEPSYEDITTTFGSTGISVPTWADPIADTATPRTAVYRITSPTGTTLDAGIKIDMTTGEVTVSNTAAVESSGV